MSEPSWPSSLEDNPYVRMAGNVVICDGPGWRHRAFPTGVRLPNGDLLVGFRVGSDHHLTLDGAFYTTRSRDNGLTWEAPVCLYAQTGWDVCANIGQYPDGVMPDGEPFLHALVRQYRWVPGPAPEQDHREAVTYFTVSRDNGYCWEERFALFDTPVARVKTERGPMEFWMGFGPHSYGTTMVRLSDGRVMALFVGSRGRVYRPSRMANSWAMAGFSSDDLRTWEFRTVSPPRDEVDFQESDVVRLPDGRLVAIYGNNTGTPWFHETHSDDEGQTWSPMRQLNFRGDSPSMVRMSSGALLAAFRHVPHGRETPSGPNGHIGVGLAASPDGGETWEVLGNIHDQSIYDMAYPDLIKLDNGRFLCVYYTEYGRRPIPSEVELELAAVEPIRTLFKGSRRPSAIGELQSEIRGIFLEERR